MAANKAATNRKVRTEALRDQLANQGHVQHIIDIVGKVEDGGEDFSSLDLQRYKLVIDTKLALIKKYLPDLKQVEIEGQIDSTLTIVRKEYKPSN